MALRLLKSSTDALLVNFGWSDSESNNDTPSVEHSIPWPVNCGPNLSEISNRVRELAVAPDEKAN